MQQKVMSHADICNLSGRKRFWTPDRFFLLTQKLLFATNIQDIPELYFSDITREKIIEFLQTALS